MAIIDSLGSINIWFSVVLAILYSTRLHTNGNVYKYFTYLLITYAVIQSGMLLMIYFYKGKENLFFFLPYFFFQFITLSFFYRYLLDKRKIVLVIIPVVLFLVFQYVLVPELLNRYNPLGVTITQSLIIIYSLLYMYRSLTNPGSFSLINVGIFLYMIPSTLIFASGNFVKGDELQLKLHILLGDIRDVCYFLLQLLILIEWWRNFYRVKTT